MAEQQQPTESGLSEYYEGYQQLELEGVEENLRKTRNAISIVAAMVVLSGVLLYYNNGKILGDLWLNLGLAAIYATLALLTKKIPLASVIIALIIFLGTWIFNFVVVDTSYIYKGIIFKGIIFFYLIKGIGYAKDAEELRSRRQS